jgi:hypothetical protein
VPEAALHESRHVSQNVGVGSNLLGLFSKYNVALTDAMTVLHENLDPNDYVYKDVAAFLVRHRLDRIVIVTSGVAEWQEIKLSFTPLLYSYAQKIIPGNKGEFLRESLEINENKHEIRWPAIDDLPFDEFWLCDDRIDALLPLEELAKTAPIKLHYIERPDAKYTFEGKSEYIHKHKSLARL